MVTHYKEKYERLEFLIEVLQSNYRALREDYLSLKRSYDQLEEWANDQEQRANALHDVIDTFINRNGVGVRRDLLEAFNEVANDLEINIDDLLAYEEEEFEIDVMSDNDE